MSDIFRNNKYLEETAAVSCRRPTAMEIIQERLKALDEQTIKTARLKELLEKNPEFEELLNLSREIL